MNRKHPQIKIQDRFGRWLVLERQDLVNDHKQEAWLCRCDCGTERVVRANALQVGGHGRPSRSCGCLRYESHNRTHGEGYDKTPEYNSWVMMRNRVNNLNADQFQWYQGREDVQIQICEGWNSYESFLNSLGRKPSPKHSIDRINNDGHYSCGECVECIAKGWPMNGRWATQREQMRNTRANRFLTIGGVTHCLVEWAEISGVNEGTIRTRVAAGWPSEQWLIPSLRKAA